MDENEEWVQFNVRIDARLKADLESIKYDMRLSYPEVLRAIVDAWNGKNQARASVRVATKSAPAVHLPAPVHTWPSVRPEPKVDPYALVDYSRAANREEDLAWREMNVQSQKLGDAPIDYPRFKRIMAERARRLAEDAQKESASSATPPSVETAGHPARGPGRMQQEDDAAGLKAALERATSASSTRSSAGSALADADDLW